MANGIRWDETEAAKLLLNNKPSDAELGIKDGFVRISVVDKRLIRYADIARERLEVFRLREPPQTTWYSGLFEWLKVAKEAANSFWAWRAGRRTLSYGWARLWEGFLSGSPPRPEGRVEDRLVARGYLGTR